MRAGDVVFHRPSGETWVLAYAERGYVSACGWPEAIDKEEDCEVVEAASDAVHLAMLREWAAKKGQFYEGRQDHRAGVCARQLAEIEAPPVAPAAEETRDPTNTGAAGEE